MPPRQRLSDADRGRALARVQEGISLREIGRRLQVSHSVIQRLWDRWRATGTLREARRPGWPRTNTRQHDRYVVLSCFQALKRDRTAIARALQRNISSSSNIAVSDQTIRNRLSEAGLGSGCAVVRPPSHCVSFRLSEVLRNYSSSKD